MTNVHEDLKLLDKLMANESSWVKGQYFNAEKKCGCIVGWCLEVANLDNKTDNLRFDMFDTRVRTMLKAIGFDSTAEAIFYNDSRLSTFRSLKEKISKAVRSTAPPKVKKLATIKKALK